MTISADTQRKFPCELSFTSSVGTSVAVSTSSEVTGIAGGSSQAVAAHSEAPTQFILVAASHTVSGGTATITLFLADSDVTGGAGKMRVIDTLSIAASTTMRASHDNASGDYVATVTAALSGKATVDLFPGIGDPGKYPKIYAACTALSGGTVTIRIAPGRLI